MKHLGLAAAVFFGLLTLASSLFTLDETEQAIITQFGEPVGAPRTDPACTSRCRSSSASTRSRSAGSSGAATPTRSRPRTRSTSGWTPTRAGA